MSRLLFFHIFPLSLHKLPPPASLIDQKARIRVKEKQYTARTQNMCPLRLGFFRHFKRSMHGFYQQFGVPNRQLCTFILFQDFYQPLSPFGTTVYYWNSPVRLFIFGHFSYTVRLLGTLEWLIDYEIFPILQSSI